jgi:hypothetical protein
MKRRRVVSPPKDFLYIYIMYIYIHTEVIGTLMDMTTDTNCDCDCKFWLQVQPITVSSYSRTYEP